MTELRTLAFNGHKADKYRDGIFAFYSLPPIIAGTLCLFILKEAVKPPVNTAGRREEGVAEVWRFTRWGGH